MATTNKVKGWTGVLMTEDSDTSNPKRPGARVLSSFVFLGTTGSVYTRCAMRERQFNSNEWITKLAAAIEEDVTRSDAPWLDYPEEAPHDSAEGDRQWRLRLCLLFIHPPAPWVGSQPCGAK